VRWRTVERGGDVDLHSDLVLGLMTPDFGLLTRRLELYFCNWKTGYGYLFQVTRGLVDCIYSSSYQIRSSKNYTSSTNIYLILQPQTDLNFQLTPTNSNYTINDNV
jgi:hypothetical protein